MYYICRPMISVYIIYFSSPSRSISCCNFSLAWTSVFFLSKTSAFILSSAMRCSSLIIAVDTLLTWDNLLLRVTYLARGCTINSRCVYFNPNFSTLGLLHEPAINWSSKVFNIHIKNIESIVGAVNCLNMQYVEFVVCIYYLALLLLACKMYTQGYKECWGILLKF